MDKEAREMIREGVKRYGIKWLPKFIFAYYKGYGLGVLEGARLRRKESRNGR